MKLLFDENLPPSLAATLGDLYPGSQHVHGCGLGAADDGAVWEYAKKGAFVIVSKDSDFYSRLVLFGSPPKVIWLRVGNCPTKQIQGLLRDNCEKIRSFADSAQSGLVLVLPRARKRR